MAVSTLRICEVETCEAKHLARGYCQMHYYRLKRGHADVTAPTRFTKRKAIIVGKIAKLPLGINACKGYAIVDKEFAYLESLNWSLDGHGYPCAYYEGKVTKLHHLTLGKPKTNMEIDHINRNKIDARLSNLREVTHKENMANVPKELFNKRSPR